MVPALIAFQKEDTGTLVLAGYSAGARSAPAFGWAQNLQSKSAAGRMAAANDDVQTSVIFALAWQLIRNHAPEMVLNDFEVYFHCNDLKRMDANGQISAEARSSKPFVQRIPSSGPERHARLRARAQSHYEGKKKGVPRTQRVQHSSSEVKGSCALDIGCHAFQFKDAELAPLWAKITRAVHYEKQPHKFAAPWAPSRTSAESAGCNFYDAKHGIRIQQAANTMVVWQPGNMHATSLPDCDPLDPEPVFLQRGLAFVTSPRLPAMWRKYLDGHMARNEALEHLRLGGDHALME
ncbi:hypothetical protein DXG01_009392 [Tephrocybe rancida]|nr:hypothetical protein DXG01_009392 [Tephrocybe rancida]